MKLYAHQEELRVLARSDGGQAKQIAMRRSLPGRDRFLLRAGAAKRAAGRSFGFVKLTIPVATETVTRASFHFQVDKVKLREAEQRDRPTTYCAPI